MLLFVGALGFVSCEKQIKNEDDMPFKISKVLDKEIKSSIFLNFNNSFDKKNTNSSDFNFNDIIGVIDENTGDISYSVSSFNNENIKLGVYPTLDGKYNFLIVSSNNSNGIKSFEYRDKNGNLVVTLDVDIETGDIIEKRLTSLGKTNCGQAVADCLSDNYTQQGWASVVGWGITLFQPWFGVAMIAGCTGIVCF